MLSPIALSLARTRTPTLAARSAFRQLSTTPLRRDAAKQASDAANTASKATKQAGEAAKSAASEASAATESAAKQASEAASTVSKEASQASGKVADAAGSAATEAQKTASNLQAAASKHLGSAAEKAKELGGPLAARAQGIFGNVAEPVVYNLKVAGALAKQVYIAEGLAPPTNFNTISTIYRDIWSKAQNPSFWRKLVESGDWKKFAIYSVEALGFFTIGEMIGRRSIVGYKLDTSSHGHGAHH